MGGIGEVLSLKTTFRAICEDQESKHMICNMLSIAQEKLPKNSGNSSPKKLTPRMLQMPMISNKRTKAFATPDNDAPTPTMMTLKLTTRFRSRSTRNARKSRKAPTPPTLLRKKVVQLIPTMRKSKIFQLSIQNCRRKWAYMFATSSTVKRILKMSSKASKVAVESPGATICACRAEVKKFNPMITAIRIWIG